MTRIVTLVLGYSFLVLGVLGLVLPFLQGFLFIFIGLILLSKHASWANRSLGY
ncbi:PGPGW domain-containing protein, partial [Streptomyces sp. URMC 126]